jgi:hypothetical protein
MGKDAHDEGGCCYACERFAGRDVPPVERPALDTSQPHAVAFEIRRAGRPVTVYVPRDTVIDVGRGHRNTLVLDDDALSRHQATFSLRPDGVYVEDRNSTCGTYVDGGLIGKPTKLGEGAVVSFGFHDIRVIRR